MKSKDIQPGDVIVQRHRTLMADQPYQRVKVRAIRKIPVSQWQPAGWWEVEDLETKYCVQPTLAGKGYRWKVATKGKHHRVHCRNLEPLEDRPPLKVVGA